MVETLTLPVKLDEAESEAAIERFVRFLQFETVSSIAPETGAYIECANFLIEQLKDIRCLDEVFLLEEAPDHSPVVVGVWKGVDETLPVLLLNSHYDVVPAASEGWTVAPFEGLRQGGKIYGRGAQDMKCVCLQYIEALRLIRKLNGAEWRPERSIYVTFVPDEEVGGGGMAAFLESKVYKNLPGIALALDEGLASTTSTYSVFYGERCPWWVDVTATGPTGHGSRFIDTTAVEQLIEVANKALEFREGQRKQLGLDSKHENCVHAVARKTLGDVTSLNITVLEAGVKAGNHFVLNCVPPKARMALDIRISPHTPPSEIGDMLDQWCKECSRTEQYNVQWTYAAGSNDAKEHHLTSTDPAKNPWYAIFESQMTEMGLSIDPQVFPAATDSRFLRALGIRALGFSPMINTEIMLHENDEYIPEALFIEGISVYVGLIYRLASCKDNY